MVGGPLALAKSGDRIKPDVAARRLELLVCDEELEARHKALKIPSVRNEDSCEYRKLFMTEVLQADKGCDLEFLVPESTTTVPGPQ